MRGIESCLAAAVYWSRRLKAYDDIDFAMSRLPFLKHLARVLVLRRLVAAAAAAAAVVVLEDSTDPERRVCRL